MADPKNKQGSREKRAQYESFEDMPLDVLRANRPRPEEALRETSPYFFS
jgi:hypothetical protein